MDTLRESALRLLYGLLWSSGEDPGGLAGDVLARERGRVSGTLGALLSLGAISAQEAREWRAHFAAGARLPVVSDAGCREEASRMLGEFLDALHEDVEDDRGRAVSRFSGALSALAEIGAVDRAMWNTAFCEVLSQDRGGRQPAEPFLLFGTDQDLIGVVAGRAELLEGWRVLYGLRFADDVVFACWNEAEANRRCGDDREDEDSEDPSEFDLSDDLGTCYGGGDAWGDSGFRCVSFPTEGSERAPAWMALISRSGQSIRLPT